MFVDLIENVFFLLAYTEYPEHSMTLTSIASILFIVFENIDNAGKSIEFIGTEKKTRISH